MSIPATETPESSGVADVDEPRPDPSRRGGVSGAAAVGLGAFHVKPVARNLRPACPVHSPAGSSATLGQVSVWTVAVRQGTHDPPEQALIDRMRPGAEAGAKRQRHRKPIQWNTQALPRERQALLDPYVDFHMS